MRWAPCEHMSLNPPGMAKSLSLPHAHCARQCSRELGDSLISTTALVCPRHVSVYLEIQTTPGNPTSAALAEGSSHGGVNSTQQQHRGDLGSQLAAAEGGVCSS